MSAFFLVTGAGAGTHHCCQILVDMVPYTELIEFCQAAPDIIEHFPFGTLLMH
jgi:hypothetical protein